MSTDQNTVRPRRQTAALLIGVFVVLISLFFGLFFGLGSLSRFRQAEAAWEVHNAHATAVAIALENFNRHTGYGGFIHNFKNLVLRRDLPRYQQKIEADIVGLRADLDHLDTLINAPEDEAAIAQLRATFEEYATRYANALPMLAAGASSDEIDAAVQVNDGPALAALAQLRIHVSARAEQAQQLAQATHADAQRFARIGGGLMMTAILAAILAIVVMTLFQRRIVAANQIIRKTQEQLVEREQQLLETQRIAHLGGWKLDLPSGRLTWTEETFRIFGLPVTAQLSAEQAISYFLPESRKLFEQALNAAIQHGRPFNLELQLRTAQGEVRWVCVQSEGKSEGPGPSVAVVTFQDISERKQAQLANEAARGQLQATLDALPDLLFDVDSQGHIASYHSGRSDLLAAPPDAFIGRSFADLLPPDAARACQSAIDEAAENGFSNGVTYRLTLPQGEHWFELSVAPLHADAKSDQRFIMICRDITERTRANESLQQAASVFSHTREGIFITDVKGTIVDVNEAFTRITGYSREEVIGQNPRILNSGRQDVGFYRAMWNALTEQGHWSGEVWNRRNDGEVYAEMLTISAIRDSQGATQRYVALFSDITASKLHQSQLEQIAHFDALTNLPNRMLLTDRLNQSMAQAQRRAKKLAVAYLDLDGFKVINDTHGHQVGDHVLIILAKRMKEALREGDTLARIGGDEFVAVLIDFEDAQASTPLLNRLLAAAALPVQLGELHLQVSASLGVTFYSQDDTDADQLLRQADQAMYQAKVAGKNCYAVFDAAHDSSIRDHHESIKRIRLALAQNEFVLYYQPKVNMRSGKVTGAEALIRWQHPDNGLLAPAAFLPLIEDHPLAIDVGEWVIDTAMHQMEVWHAAGLDLPVSVNVGARQLLQDDFIERLQAVLARHPQVPPNCIEFEVLETSALADMAQASRVIDDCARMGVRFALDDFGTGYSSLTYLKRLQVALLKIDQSFVRDMLDDPDDLAILQGIIGLAAAFNRDVIAEGVESVAHGTALLQLGCELAQGYGIARPMPADQLPTWTTNWQPDAAWGRSDEFR